MVVYSQLSSHKFFLIFKIFKVYQDLWNSKMKIGKCMHQSLKHQSETRLKDCSGSEFQDVMCTAGNRISRLFKMIYKVKNAYEHLQRLSASV